MSEKIELEPADFNQWIGCSYEELDSKVESIFQWWPVVERGRVTNFISMDGDLYLSQNHDVKNIKILEDYAIIKQESKTFSIRININDDDYIIEQKINEMKRKINAFRDS